MRKLIVFCLLAVLLLSSAQAEEQEEAQFWGVIGKRMEVRKYGSANAPVLGSIEPGIQVDVYKKGRTWTKIDYSGRVGYVQTKFIELVQRKDPFEGPMPGVPVFEAMARTTQTVSFLPEGYRYAIQVPAGTALGIHRIRSDRAYFPYRREPEDMYLPLSVLEVTPLVTWDKAGPGDLIYAFSTFYTTSLNKEGNAGRLDNIELATKRLTHILVHPGEVFSFNTICGPYTEENGYKPAPILSGESKMGFGGGVCQVCSTIYNIVLRIPAVIVDMNWHSQGGTSYLPAGYDATVSNTKDMQFRNILPYTLRIEFESGGGVMTALCYRASEEDEK